MAGRASRRTSAFASSSMNPWYSLRNSPAGLISPRIHAGSPVRCTIEHMRVGMLTSSRAAAIASSLSVNGSPAWG